MYLTRLESFGLDVLSSALFLVALLGLEPELPSTLNWVTSTACLQCTTRQDIYVRGPFFYQPNELREHGSRDGGGFAYCFGVISNRQPHLHVWSSSVVLPKL